jgi:small subunit ribosomal protein S9
MMSISYLKTGRRKNAVARAAIIDGGSGRIIVNNRPLDEYFLGLERHKRTALKPLDVYPAAKSYDFYINVKGGGITGQAGAISHCIARTILSLNDSSRAVLKKEGLLTRDSRMVERKKPGRPKARKRFQFSKR